MVKRNTGMISNPNWTVSHLVKWYPGLLGEGIKKNWMLSKFYLLIQNFILLIHMQNLQIFLNTISIERNDFVETCRLCYD